MKPEAGVDCATKLSAIHEYDKRGWLMTPTRGKRPYRAGWQSERLGCEAMAEIVGDDPTLNIGVLLGAPSCWLVDIDLDHPLAVALANEYLPQTDSVFGRAGKQRSHRLYYVSAPVETQQHRLPDRSMIAELRSTGGQTVFPPSTHDAGEAIEWDQDGDPSNVEPNQLSQAVGGLVDAVRDLLGCDRPPPNSNGDARSEQTIDRAAIIDRARRYLAAIPPAISGQGGHDQTFYAACKLLHGFALSIEEASPLLAEWNLSCQPPWNEKELRHKLEDARKQPSPRGNLCVTSPEDQTQRDGMMAGEAVQAVVRNFEFAEESNDGKLALVPKPLSIITIGSIIADLTGGWPRRVGTSLFIPSAGRPGIAWLPDADSLFGYLGEATAHPPEFRSSQGFHTKRELFSYLVRTVTDYSAVEELPHEPPIPGHFYACEPPESGSGDALNELINRFSPETDIDRDLILAAFVTPFWGGRGGTRPAFCITSDAGKGCGKSTLAASIGQLAGGALDVSANEDIAAMKARLLSSEGVTKRAVWLDNVKSHRLSWAELESLITSPVISGKKLYVGEGQRPNSLTFLLTMNGVSLSTDMAQRCVVIKLRRPDYSGTWAEETRYFIEAHRSDLVADVLGFLRSPAKGLSKFSRWGDWERGVLARLPNPTEAQTTIRERQAGVDVDGEESALIEEFFAAQLIHLGYDIKFNRVFIPSRVAARWLGWATNELISVAKASRLLKQRITESQMRRLLECPRRDLGRGFEFWGDDATGETYLQRDLDEQIRCRGERQVA